MVEGRDALGAEVAYGSTGVVGQGASRAYHVAAAAYGAFQEFATEQHTEVRDPETGKVLGSLNRGAYELIPEAQLAEGVSQEQFDAASRATIAENVKNKFEILTGGGLPGGGTPAKLPPNPFGKRGGPAHQARIAEAEERLNAGGFETVSGGSLPEQAVGVGRGKKRFPDLVVRDAQGKTVAVQVGRATKSGRPIARERRALKDLRGSGQFEHVFFISYQ